MGSQSVLQRNRLLSRVSSLYYEKGMQQQEISERFGLSRSGISRILKQAREEGVVNISIVQPPGMYHELEYALEQKFGLKEAIVIDVNQPETREAIQHQIGLAAGDYFLRIIKPGDVVGLAWGRTMYEFVSSIHRLQCENVHIVQLLGGLGPPESNVHSSAICSRLAYSLGCSYTLLPSPGVAGSLESKGAFLSDSYVSNALDLIKKVNLAFVSVGNAAEDCLAMLLNIITPEDRLYLINNGAVGDIDLRYYDISGNPVHSNFDQRVIGADLEQFKKYDRVVGLAGGDEKYEAVLGVLNGKYINVLITNYRLARKLVGK